MARCVSTGVLAVALCGAACRTCIAQTLPVGYTATTLSTGIAFPTAMTVAPDGSVYMTQQTGVLKVWQAGTTSTVATFTVNSSGERGLLGVAVDPAFATNRYVYVYHTTSAAPIHNTVRRITVNAAGDAVVAGSEVVLLDLNNLSTATNHNGGAIHFGADGKLYVSVGDNASSANSQSITTLLGKMLRINPDPANVIPTDNPASFPGIAGTTAGNNRAIWAVGLRNPFTFGVHPLSGRIFIDDVGEGTWEEINDGLAGRNYGWPTTEGRFTAASFPNFTNPLVAYQHSNGANNYPPGIGTFTGFAIVGGAVYAPAPGSKPNFPISFDGDYFFGDEVSSYIRTFDPAANNGAAFATGVGSVVGFGLAADNTLLVLRGAGGSSGVLFRITYTGTSGSCCNPSGACSLSNGLNCPAGSSFIWGTVSCTPQPCPQPMGACCAVDSSCTSTTNATCIGTYQGDNTLCLPNPCPPPTGACCDGSSCTITEVAGCAGATQHFAGAGSTCNVGGNTTTPCCKADFDHDGAVVVTDIFQFLSAWFAGDPRADINIDGVETVTDIFTFLGAWFTGC